MALFDNIINMFGSDDKEEKNFGNMVGYFNVGNHTKDYKYQDLANEGYLKNAIVYRCVNEISKGMSAIPFRILNQNGDIVEQHPVIELLRKPNPLQSYSEFLNSLVGYLLLSGNSYVQKVGPERRPPRELYLLRPDRIEIKGSGKSVPDKYCYKVNGKIVAEYDVDPETGISDLKHVKLWHPLDDYYGCSPLRAAAVEIDQHNLAAKHNINLLDNGARPSGAVVFKPKDDTGMQVNLTESQRQQLLTDINNRFTGASNAGRPLLLEGDFDWKEMGLSPKDMDFGSLKHMSATDIALCFGVPSQLVGVPDAQTYANVAEARLALYEETIIPLAKKIESDLNEWLIPLYNDSLHMEFDYEDIPALSERRRRIYENVNSAVLNGIMTRNEARERLGLTPLDGADDLYISASMFPIGAEEPVAPETTDSPEDAKEYDEFEDLVEEGFDVDDYEPVIKALSDIDLTPTSGMKSEAQKGLDWRREFGRGGTAVGVARARDLVNGKDMSISTVKRMYSFFARHAVDKQAEGFSPGEKGYPSNGRIAWALWGGDAGQSWSKKKRDQIEREESKYYDELEFENTFYDHETKALNDRLTTALKNKLKEHNDKYTDPAKRTTLGALRKVFNRGVGAFRNNPASVRPGISSEDQWALARVNNFLRTLRTGKFRSGKHDTDLLPKGHPQSSK